MKTEEKKQTFLIDEDTLYSWLNQITCIHNQIVKEQMFSAGYNICALQNEIVKIINET